MNNKLYTDPTYQRFKKYKKKYSLGDNFDLNLKESNSEVYLKDKVNWDGLEQNLNCLKNKC